MFKIRTYNQIFPTGLEKLSDPLLYSVGNDLDDAMGIVLRSYKLSEQALNPELRAISRAGAGYNNIPVAACTARGIVVFNTPGANANSVKELVLAALLNVSRNILAGQNFVKSLSDITDAQTLHRKVEEQKKRFRGNEIAGKTLGVIGLGYIGSQVADAAQGLGMRVLGYDPALSVDAAWRIPNEVGKMESMAALLSQSDYITIHAPLLDSTRHLINRDTLAACKTGSVLLNFARDEIVDPEAIAEALKQKKLSSYVGDFPEISLLRIQNTMLTPHLGASTAEAEENCAAMACEQLKNFLEHGTIVNSVNFPTAKLELTTECRLTVVNKNVPNMLGQILSVLAKHNVNVADMLNKSRNDIAYNLIDIESSLQADQIEEIKQIDGVILARQC